MRHLLSVLLLTATFLSVGCATVHPEFDLSDKFHAQENEPTVGLSVQNQEKAMFLLSGNIGLLDLAIITAATSQVTDHIEAIDISEFNSIKPQITKALNDHDFRVKSITNVIDKDELKEFKAPKKEEGTYYALHDYTGLKTQYGVDYLLLVQVLSAGTIRTYHAMVPLSDPQALFDVKVEAIDTRTNELLWNKTISKTRLSEGEWDEPPYYPGLTKSIYAALEDARMEILNQLHTGLNKNKRQLVSASLSDNASAPNNTLEPAQ